MVQKNKRRAKRDKARKKEGTRSAKGMCCVMSEEEETDAQAPLAI
jgi:hypothetical protein